LNSTVIYELIKMKGLKIVLFDLMLEYTGLLIDLLVQTRNAFILSLDADSLPGGDSLLSVLRRRGNGEDAVQNITNTLLLPRELAPSRNLYKKAFKALLDQNKFKVLAIGSALTGEILYNRIAEELPAPNLLGNARGAVVEWLDTIQRVGDSPVNQQYVATLSRQVQDFIDNGIPESFDRRPENQPATQVRLPGFSRSGPQNQPVQSRPSQRIQLSQSARVYFIGVKRKLGEYIQAPEEHPIRPECNVTMTDLIRLLNDEENNLLIVVQSSRDDNLRQFSSSLVTNIFNDRKRRGANGPQVLFLYDEADEFMPSQATAASYGLAKAAITMLARRGRKFGLGLSFATQRVAYLDTSILAQPHTYLISKLPRQYDREAVSNAFGLSEDMLRRTLKFSKGQWLLVSYEATGLENVPLPVQFPNANKRINEFLEKLNSPSNATT
jgi:hypothetical protein